jgi:hypothetical protein
VLPAGQLQNSTPYESNWATWCSRQRLLREIMTIERAVVYGRRDFELHSAQVLTGARSPVHRNVGPGTGESLLRLSLTVGLQVAALAGGFCTHPCSIETFVPVASSCARLSRATRNAPSRRRTVVI